MSAKILINASDPEEIRVATVKDGRLEEFRIESAAREITQGNIYKGVIARIEPSLQAVFVDYGAERNGFLQKHDIHDDYYHEDDARDVALHRLVKRGQGVMVQIAKDPLGTKGAMLTTLISLPGRHVVLMPGHSVRGVSRKIEDEAERARLKAIVAELEVPENFGVIVRTAGQGCSKTMISKDLKDLLRLWKTIRGKVMQEPTTALLYKESALVIRSIRDSFSPEVSEILIDDANVFREAQELISIFSSKHNQVVRLYEGDKPLFSKFQLEDQIASIYENRVRLKSGGSIVIAPTEALVAVDVNSGKSTHEKSVEQTAFQTNLEAAEEIARQLRLRDLGGLIVIDFIDMKESKHRAEVERARPPGNVPPAHSSVHRVRQPRHLPLLPGQGHGPGHGSAGDRLSAQARPGGQQDGGGPHQGRRPPGRRRLPAQPQAPGHRGAGEAPQHRHRHRGRRRPAALRKPDRARALKPAPRAGLRVPKRRASRLTARWLFLNHRRQR